MVLSEDSTAIIVLKDSLVGRCTGPVRDLDIVVNGSGADDWTAFLEGEERRIAAEFPDRLERGYRADFSGHVAIALAEAITNFQFYANEGDHDTPLYVYRWRDDSRLYYCIKGCGDGFDPRTVSIGTSDSFRRVPRKDGPGKGYFGGWGHQIMAEFAHFVAYDPEGKSMYLFFQLPDAVPASRSSPV